jgi:hypothetical protein
MDGFPFPGMGRPVVAVPAPRVGPGYRIWYEARLADERHELRTEHIPR